ncbi:MAG: polysaccharide deacetylase family protein [Chloroflexota bacterium]
MTHYVSLLFDVEDLCWPDSDDINLDLVQILNQQDVRGTFFVVGEKAKLFSQRNRLDIIQALADHDIGTHTTSHSVHPTIAEYLADLSWEEGVLTAIDKEGAGIDMIETHFGRRPTCWGQPGGSWGPQIHKAMERLNVPVTVYPKTRVSALGDLHWYAGSLVFPDYQMVKFDQGLTDDGQFNQLLDDMATFLDDRMAQGARWTGIFVCHPTRLKAVEFWDGLNFAEGINTDPADYQMPTLLSDEAYQTSLKNFDQLVTTLKGDPRLQIATVGEVSQVFRPPDKTIFLYQLDETVDEISRLADIPTHFFNFSPAELLDLLVRVYISSDTIPETFQRRAVGGPVDEPPSDDPSSDLIFWPDFLSACQSLNQYITHTGYLPASISVRGGQWSVGAFYRAVIDAWFAFRAGNPPPSISWKPSPIYPAVGQEIASVVQDDYEGWPIHTPGRDLNTLLMHTCFQCWTLRPAYE